MSISEKLDPNRETKRTHGLKAEQTFHRVTFNPSSASAGETLYIQVPNLSENTVLIPNTLALKFNLTVTQPTLDANRYLVNNIGRNLVSRFKVKLAGEIIQDIAKYDLFKTYHDLYKTETSIEQGINSEKLRKIRAGAANKATTGVERETAINGAYGTKYIIPLDHEILTDHGVFYPRPLSSSLEFELTLAEAKDVVTGADSSKVAANVPAFTMTNLELQYAVIHDETILAREVEGSYLNGKSFLYEHVNLYKSFIIKKGTDTVINQTVNIPRRSLSGLLLLFVDTYTAGARDSEKFSNPNLTDIKVTINGEPNKLYSQGLKARDFWNMATKRFEEVNPLKVSVGDFYHNKFALWLDFRTIDDPKIHGGGLRLVNTQDGIQLEMTRTATGSGNMNCYIFVVSDAQGRIMNKQYIERNNLLRMISEKKTLKSSF